MCVSQSVNEHLMAMKKLESFLHTIVKTCQKYATFPWWP